ncbi:hypothetical protein ACI3KS_16420 [Microbacterium sp. ZW T5_45]|uniref:hypothetical protein n=1 Tax=Microbacterium sp. ZW T5_45 TaxID=3378080 RepID=UPI003852CF3E
METLVIIAIVIVVLLVLVGVVATRSSARRSSAPAAPRIEVPIGPDASAEVDRLLAAGKKIEAIKVYRDATGTRLADAKDRIDRWAPGTTAVPIVPAVQPQDPASFRASLPASVAAEIDSLLAAGRPIEAIKLVREQSRLGLAESKRVIDHWTPGTF